MAANHSEVIDFPLHNSDKGIRRRFGIWRSLSVIMLGEEICGRCVSAELRPRMQHSPNLANELLRDIWKAICGQSGDNLPARGMLQPALLRIDAKAILRYYLSEGSTNL